MDLKFGCEASAGGSCLHHVVIEFWSSAEEREGRGGGQLSGGMAQRDARGIQSMFVQPSVFKGPMHLEEAETVSQKQKEGSLGRKVSGSAEEGDSKLDRHRLISGDEYCRRQG